MKSMRLSIAPFKRNVVFPRVDITLAEVADRGINRAVCSLEALIGGANTNCGRALERVESATRPAGITSTHAAPAVAASPSSTIGGLDMDDLDLSDLEDLDLDEIEESLKV